MVGFALSSVSPANPENSLVYYETADSIAKTAVREGNSHPAIEEGERA